MQVRILGSAAGGGVPQWNCRCPNCGAARDGSPDVRPRTQSSVAVSADGRAWFLLNVSPDVRQQILAFPKLGPPEGQQRGTAIAGCVLTDAELDHTAGLLILREGPRMPVFSTPWVQTWLSEIFPADLILAAYCAGDWAALPLNEFINLPFGGPQGSLVWLAEMPALVRAYVHINNTNPMLNRRSAAYQQVVEQGVRVGADGDDFIV